ncbi:hypothetical protein D3C81_1664570 [compost metagenome]
MSAGGGRGAGATGRALLALGREAIPVGAVGTQARDLDVDTVGGGGVGEELARGGDAAELIVRGDFPLHRNGGG